MLDLEIPTHWAVDDNVRRNQVIAKRAAILVRISLITGRVLSQLRLALHLNVAACGLIAVDIFGDIRYGDTLTHATRVLEVDPGNVKARHMSLEPTFPCTVILPVGHGCLPAERPCGSRSATGSLQAGPGPLATT